MKASLLLFCTAATLVISGISGKAVKAPLHVITYDDITKEEREYLESLNEEHRDKRSGSSKEDLLSSIKHKIGEGIKEKLGMIASGAAGASAHLSSSGSSKSYHESEHEHGHGHPEHDLKSFNFWDLKKSIFNTLLQAIKAINGGVIALTGQITKGSGYLVSAKGKLISAKGEALTKFGKSVAASAHLLPAHGSGHSGHGYEPYHHSGYGDSGHHSGYGAPSAHSAEYEHSSYPGAGSSDHFPHGPEGLLILKKAPHGHGHDDSNGNDGAPHYPEVHASDTHNSGHTPDIKSLLASLKHPLHHEDSHSHYSSSNYPPPHSQHPSGPVSESYHESVKKPQEEVNYLDYFKHSEKPPGEILSPNSLSNYEYLKSKEIEFNGEGSKNTHESFPPYAGFSLHQDHPYQNYHYDYILKDPYDQGTFF